jgi:hypothetical protein
MLVCVYLHQYLVQICLAGLRLYKVIKGQDVAKAWLVLHPEKRPT